MRLTWTAVSITTAGVARLSELDEVLDGIQEVLLAPLSPTERAQFAKIMPRLGLGGTDHPDLEPDQRVGEAG